MPDREAFLLNAYESTLAATMNSTTDTMNMTDVTGLSVAPGGMYMVIDPEDPAKREYVWVDAIAAPNLTASERYLAGSAAGSGITHDAGAVVRMVAASQHIEDLHDRIDADAAVEAAHEADVGNPHSVTAAQTGGASQTYVDNADTAIQADVDANQVTTDAHIADADLHLGSGEGGAPAGAMVMWGTASAPTGWLLCDGSAVSQATYADLYAVIGLTFGNPGGGNFNLPNFQQRFPLGKAASGTGAAIGDTGGEIDHAHAGPSHIHTMPSHFHAGPSHTHTNPTTGSGGSHNHGGNALSEQAGDGSGPSAGAAGSGHYHTISTEAAHTHAQSSTGAAGTGATTTVDPGDTNAGGTADGEALNPPFLAVNFIIKT